MSLNLRELIRASALVTAAILILAGTAPAQACGYIFAKFQVLNAAGDFVAGAKLRLLHHDDKVSILFREDELSFSNSEHAFKLHHGMCGEHYRTRLVIDGPGYEAFERTIDLPLNLPSTEHVFIIKLKKKGSREAASLDQLAALGGWVTDRSGRPLARVTVTLVASDGTCSRTETDPYGKFSFSVRAGDYSLEARSPDGIDTKESLRLVNGANYRDLKVGVEQRVQP